MYQLHPFFFFFVLFISLRISSFAFIFSSAPNRYPPHHVKVAQLPVENNLLEGSRLLSALSDQSLGALHKFVCNSSSSEAATTGSDRHLPLTSVAIQLGSR